MTWCKEEILHIHGQIIISVIVDEFSTTASKIKIQTRLDNDIVLTLKDFDVLIENYLQIKKKMEDVHRNTTSLPQE